MLDVSRLLSCGQRQAPSGIDRVEAAYARHWLAAAEPDRVGFVGLGAWGDFAAVPRRTVQAMLAALEELWAGAGPPAVLARAQRRAARTGAMAQAALLAGLGRGALRRLVRSTPHRPCVLLSVSHRALERQAAIARLRRAGVAFVPLVHDLIPAAYPEYGRPGEAERHLRRLATVGALADGVIVNSAATEAALRPHLIRRGGPPPVAVAPLGLGLAPARPGASLPPPPPEERPGPPYFVTLGTIEPRKNHLLLLHLWRDFAARLGPDAPRLLLIGRRGWENENVLDLLDRCTALRGLVEEVGPATDHTVLRLLRSARALLFPSFAEGYGLPLAEALALGTPALASDIPALREVGGTAPDYLDPLDGPGWARAILDYADARSAARAAQLERLRHWRPPRWADHFARVEELLARIVASRDGARAAGSAARADAIAWAGGGRLRPAASAAATAPAVAAGNAGVP
nr:glycosyltransferase family 1 protein [Caldovatus aquaticus]